MEAMKKDIYDESFKKNKYSAKFINNFDEKHKLVIALDSFFSMGDFF